ncbi:MULTISPECIES: hypothetical protein [unclassified Halomonas]|uniref:structural cement protein Gp24 n=1 Tax=unclassified Halomonas TaxID=2609666 RepID=UPI002076B10F|nr:MULTISPECIES: hypothetical protein [unclassified Halomonas]
MIPQMQKAFAGMKADAGFDRVESFCAAGDIGFGLVIGVGADGNVAPGGGTRLAGLALHDHTKLGGYSQYDMVSTLTKGLAWAQVTDEGAVTNGGAVQYAADGTVGDASGTALPNAVFRSEAETLQDGTVIAKIELAAPFATA